MISPKRIPFFEYKLYAGSADDLQHELSGDDGRKIINTINPHSFYVADKDKDFKEALLKSDILLPDGIGIVYANWLINVSIVQKVAGIDAFLALLRYMESSNAPFNKKVFLLGSTNNVLAAIKTRIESDFPSLEVQYFSPPFKEEFTTSDNDLMVTKINEFEPYTVFVGMTAPKQEKWVLANTNLIKARCICSVGAVFDFYSGRIKRPGKVWRFFGLEWLGRFVREPKRLWRRSLISMPYFLRMVLRESLKRRLN